MYNSACGPGSHAASQLSANVPAPNFNLNLGLSSAGNMSQNNPLSYLYMPPPNMNAQQHVFPSPVNNNSSAFFAPNMATRPPHPFMNATGTNVPDMKIFQNTLPNNVQSMNMHPNNAGNFANPGFSGSNGNVMNQASFFQTGNSFNHVHNPNVDNLSAIPHFNPWSPPPPTMNNLSNASGNPVQNTPAFQSPNRRIAWSDSSSNSTTPEISQNRNFPSKFNGAKSKASDINPWLNPPVSFPGVSPNNYRNAARHQQSSPNVNGYNSNERSGWKNNSNSNFKFSNHHGNQHQPNWKSGNFSAVKNTPNSPSFQHSGNSFKNFRNNRFQGRKNNNFRDKEDNKVNKPYTCDTCDRAFAVEEDLKLHYSQHIKCNAGNCSFEAHPKVVALHKKMQHETGYAEAINKLKDSDEIAKWRAERKRRFPTAENILKRKAEQAEKEARGEVIETKDFGQMKRPKLENRFNKRYNRNDRRNRNYNNSNPHFRYEKLLCTLKMPPGDPLSSDSDDDSHIKLNRFPGIKYLKENPEAQKLEAVITNSDSDKTAQDKLVSPNMSSDSNQEEKAIVGSDDENPIEIPVNKTSPSLNEFSENEDSNDEQPSEKCCEAEMLGNKESDIQEIIDSDDEPPFEIPAKKCVEIELLGNKELEIQEIDAESPTKTPDVKAPLNEISNSGKLISKDKVSNKHSVDNVVKGNRKPYDRNRNKFSNRRNEVEQNVVRKSTLLEKLLAEDIRHERNVIMQSIRYIVTNNFFDDE